MRIHEDVDNRIIIVLTPEDLIYGTSPSPESVDLMDIRTGNYRIFQRAWEIIYEQDNVK